MPNVTITNVHYLDSSPFRWPFVAHWDTVRCRRTFREGTGVQGIKPHWRDNEKGIQKAVASSFEKEPATAAKTYLPGDGKQLDASFARIGDCCGLDDLVLGSNFFFFFGRN